MFNSELPSEIITKILEYLDVKDAWSVALSSIRFFTLAKPFACRKLTFNTKKYLSFMKDQTNPKFTSSFIKYVRHLVLNPFSTPEDPGVNELSLLQCFPNLNILSVSAVNFPHFLFHEFSCYHANLVHLNLELKQDYLDHQPWVPSTAVFPNLKLLFICGFSKKKNDFVKFSFQITHPEKNFPSLLCLKLQHLRVDYKTLLPFLRNLTSLTELTVDLQHDLLRARTTVLEENFLETHPKPKTPFLPKLRTLWASQSFCDLLCDEFTSSLNIGESPALQTLKLALNFKDTERDIMFPISSCSVFKHLTELKLEGVILELIELIQLLMLVTLQKLSICRIQVLDIPSTCIKSTMTLPFLHMFHLIEDAGLKDWSFLDLPILKKLVLEKMELKFNIWSTVERLEFDQCEFNAIHLPASLTHLKAKCTYMDESKFLPYLTSIQCYRSSSVLDLLNPLLIHSPLRLKSLNLERTGIQLCHLGALSSLPIQLRLINCHGVPTPAMFQVSQENRNFWKNLTRLSLCDPYQACEQFPVTLNVLDSLFNDDIFTVFEALRVMPIECFEFCGDGAAEFKKLLEKPEFLCVRRGFYNFMDAYI
ncbi:hypothetical protein HMI54_004353 [Coelomomyces lativittatus]|nr:hypothetical protein HMI56_001738 [Coelomomyces lativittatus]KAJ1507042.1 hypothetical protein HMI55_000933 [Coelomomyces lativittatus]KAJ1507226.1 hypothetical protein HMI54_004353 [Coelomomyces lativittatus]